MRPTAVEVSGVTVGALGDIKLVSAGDRVGTGIIHCFRCCRHDERWMIRTVVDQNAFGIQRIWIEMLPRGTCFLFRLHTPSATVEISWVTGGALGNRSCALASDRVDAVRIKQILGDHVPVWNRQDPSLIVPVNNKGENNLGRW